MKRTILILMFLWSVTTLAAQNYIVVESEKVFKSITAYNQALTELDKLAEQYQSQVDAKFQAVEQLYQSYVNQKASLSEYQRATREQAILDKEQEAQEFQEKIFGNDGTLMKKRQELIQPIQKKVFAAIEQYAQKVGAGMVIDASNNPTLLYSDPKVNHTNQIIATLK